MNQFHTLRALIREPDARPLPEELQVRTALPHVFDALVSTFNDTRLEPGVKNLLWSTVNLCRRAADRVERELDTNEQAQRRSQKDRDSLASRRSSWSGC